VKAYITKATISHRHISIKGQKGISLIPALITICIFTILTTQVILPNQIRNANEKYIDNLANSAKILEQASLAYYSANGSWPATITGDLVPQYLPVFDTLTDVGSNWVIVDITTDLVSGSYFINNKSMAAWNPSQYKHSKAILIQAGNPQIAKALMRRIGGHARLGGKNPASGLFYSDDKKNDIVHFPLVIPGTPTIDNLNITQDITVGRNIVLTGQIMADDRTTVLFDASASNPIAIQGHSHSSKRFKRNIHPLETPIESIYQIKPVTYDYKDAFKQYKTPNAANKEIGLIAEQVLPLIPELTLVKGDKVMGVDYQKLSILLLKAIQELRTEVTSLQQNNQQLQKQMDNLSKAGTIEDISAMSSVK
jgi:hypothetical protein